MDRIFYQNEGVNEGEWQSIFDCQMGHEEIVKLIMQNDSINYYDYDVETGEVEKGDWQIHTSAVTAGDLNMETGQVLPAY